jgi:threonine/homoserine/homoserine lactone efflux protein
MPIDSLILFISLSVGLLIVPGPLVMLTISTTLQYRLSGAIWLALGSVCSGIIKGLLAMLGVAALLEIYPKLLALLQLIGALYLLWLAWQLLQSNDEKKPSQLASDADNSLKTPRAELFQRGLLSALANPKGILFFAALFPQFISPQQPLWSQALLLMTIFSLLEFLVMMVYGLATMHISQSISHGAITRAFSTWITPLILIFVSITMLGELWLSRG